MTCTRTLHVRGASERSQHTPQMNALDGCNINLMRSLDEPNVHLPYMHTTSISIYVIHCKHKDEPTASISPRRLRLASHQAQVGNASRKTRVFN